MTAVSLGRPRQSFTVREKILLIGEILAAYLAARRVRDSDEIVDVVARLRAENEAPAKVEGHEAIRAGLKLGNAVGRTLSVLPTDSRCLMRALVLTVLLARRGISSILVIGVRTDPQFGAHAWVEHQGAPLLPAGGPGMGRLIEV